MEANCQISDEVLEKAKSATGCLVPTKSSARYQKEYTLFCEWKKENHASEVNEDVMLAYLFDLVNLFCLEFSFSGEILIYSSILVYENV